MSRSSFETKIGFSPSLVLFITLTVVGILFAIAFSLNGPPVIKSPFGAVFGFMIMALLYLFIGYSVIRVPKISIDSTTISFKSIFKSKVFPLITLKSIGLTGKAYNKFTLLNEECTRLIFIDGEEEVIFLNYYRNNRELLTILQKLSDPAFNTTALLSDDFFNARFIEKADIDIAIDDTFIKYSGNYITSYNGIFFFGIPLFFSLFIVKKKDTEAMFFMFIISFFISYFAFGRELRYFYLSDSYLIIKHHLFPWSKKIFQVDEIKEVVLETPYRQANTLRVITKHFVSKKYTAGSLRDKTWKKLKQRFKSLEIPVRDEIGF